MTIRFIQFDWNEQFPIFASPDYLASQSSVFGWIGGFINHDLTFVLPYTIHHKLIFTYIAFQTETLYINQTATIQDEQTFLDDVIHFLQHNRIDFVRQPSPYVLFKTYPSHAKYAPFGTYVLGLQQSEDALWKTLHKKHRNVIRNARAQGVSIVMGAEYAHTAYKLLEQTSLRASAQPPSEKSLHTMIKALNTHILIALALHNNIPQGCALVPMSGYAGYYLLGGSITQPFLGSLNFLHWEIIKLLKAKGVQQYNMVGARLNPPKGSKLEGIQRFKSRFGGEMHQGYLWKIPLKQWKYTAYEVCYFLKHKQRGNIIVQEQRHAK